MTGIITWDQATDIGGGRGRLAEDPAKSLARVDAALGREADINEAWRSPERANALAADYESGRSTVIAVPAEKSIHCRGYAVDTDDTSDAQMAVWNVHGWYWTVYRGGVLVERWHLEYDPTRDQHRDVPMTKGADGVWRITTTIEEAPMSYSIVKLTDGDTHIVGLSTGKNLRIQHPDHVDVLLRLKKPHDTTDTLETFVAVQIETARAYISYACDQAATVNRADLDAALAGIDRTQDAAVVKAAVESVLTAWAKKLAA
ncbi:MAG: hypothetical protein J0H96_01315 [Microbacterium ginsengisoli]|nr:hypothetical protein [Microbacterium ginsengisoli]